MSSAQAEMIATTMAFDGIAEHDHGDLTNLYPDSLSALWSYFKHPLSAIQTHLSQAFLQSSYFSMITLSHGRGYDGIFQNKHSGRLAAVIVEESQNPFQSCS
jgi:hypothetical protein